MEREYFDLQFKTINDRLDKIDKSTDELFNKYNINNGQLIKIEERLISGNKKFEYVDKELNDVKTICNTCNVKDLTYKMGMIWRVFGVIGGGFLLALTGILIKLFVKGGTP